MAVNAVPDLGTFQQAEIRVMRQPDSSFARLPSEPHCLSAFCLSDSWIIPLLLYMDICFFPLTLACIMTGVGSGLSYGLGYTDWDRTLCNGTVQRNLEGMVSEVIVCVVLGGGYEISNLNSVFFGVIMHGLLNDGGGNMDITCVAGLVTHITLQMQSSPPSAPQPHALPPSRHTIKPNISSPFSQRPASKVTPLPTHP